MTTLRVSPTDLMLDLLIEISELPYAQVGTDDPGPSQLAAGLYIQGYHLGGEVERHEQFPEYDVYVYGHGFKEVEGMALDIEDALLRYPHRVTVGGKLVVVDRADVTSAAKEQPWDTDPSVIRFHGSYALATRG